MVGRGHLERAAHEVAAEHEAVHVAVGRLHHVHRALLATRHGHTPHRTARHRTRRTRGIRVRVRVRVHARCLGGRRAGAPQLMQQRHLVSSE